MILNSNSFFQKIIYRLLVCLLPDFKLVNNVECCVSTVFYHSRVDMSILSISSFFYFSGMSMTVFGIDDGSLTKWDKIRLHSKFNLKLMSKIEAENSMKSKFDEFPNFIKYRLANDTSRTKNKFDALFLSPCDKVVYIEGDVLFLKKPNEIIRWIIENQKTFFFMEHNISFFKSNNHTDSDYIIRLLIDKYKFKLLSKSFNTGLMCIPDVHMIDANNLEKVFKYFNEVNYSKMFCAEETCLAIISNHLDSKILPSRRYLCPATFSDYERININNAVLIHYIDITKDFYLRDVLNTILSILQKKLKSILTF